ncbi:MAG: aldehyde dehydrogenase family protein [Nitrospira sp.]|nr:aldehyde dehydrogenase family protein [Nitrospira sp.]
MDDAASLAKHIDSPHGGHNQSGWGREMGHDVPELYTEVKAVTVRP